MSLFLALLKCFPFRFFFILSIALRIFLFCTKSFSNIALSLSSERSFSVRTRNINTPPDVRFLAPFAMSIPPNFSITLVFSYNCIALSLPRTITILKMSS
uniref:Uncharacterized protein n=1 Tax=Panstrongylus lignarius TaxID=156445 RepID=A0A224XQW0_9HEMI